LSQSHPGRAAQELRTCEVVVVGAGLAGLIAARALAGAGTDVLVVEAQNRVGGHMLTDHLPDGTFIDAGAEWIYPGQTRMVALTQELGIPIFPTYGEGATVDWRQGQRTIYTGAVPATDPQAEAALRDVTARLARMAATVPVDAPWRAPDAATWDRQAFHDWLDDNVPSELARNTLVGRIEGIFAGGLSVASVLSSLYFGRSVKMFERFGGEADAGPDLRVDGGTQHADELADEDPCRLPDALLARGRPVRPSHHGHQPRGAGHCRQLSRVGHARRLRRPDQRGRRAATGAAAGSRTPCHGPGRSGELLRGPGGESY